MKKCNVLICSHYGHDSSECDKCKFRNVNKNEKNVEDQRIHYAQRASETSAHEIGIEKRKKRR